jgi:hypothetical protein
MDGTEFNEKSSHEVDKQFPTVRGGKNANTKKGNILI